MALELVAVEPSPRFPKSFWTFDVKLANRSDAARWFLIPDPLEKTLDLDRGADTIDVVALGSEARVRMLRIAATHNLVALLLGPRAEVALRNLKLTSWEERPVEAIEIWAVREILLDGEAIDAERLGGAGLLVTGSVEVDAGVEEAHHGWLDPEMKAHPLSYQADQRWSLDVRLGDLPPPWASVDRRD